MILVHVPEPLYWYMYLSLYNKLLMISYCNATAVFECSTLGLFGFQGSCCLTDMIRVCLAVECCTLCYSVVLSDVALFDMVGQLTLY